MDFISKAERKFMQRIREFYIEESAEMMKCIRLPVQVYAEAMDWDLEQLKAAQSLKTELGM